MRFKVYGTGSGLYKAGDLGLNTEFASRRGDLFSDRPISNRSKKVLAFRRTWRGGISSGSAAA
jgi:hypothetical protein